MSTNIAGFTLKKTLSNLNTTSEMLVTTDETYKKDFGAGDPLIYILAVISFYVIAIVLLMIKSIHEHGSDGVASHNPFDHNSSLIKSDHSSAEMFNSLQIPNNVVKAEVHRNGLSTSQAPADVIEAFPDQSTEGRSDV